MEGVCSEVHVEDISLYSFSMAQNMAMVRKAMEQSGWQVTAITENTIECHTIADNFSGEIIVVEIKKNKATLHSRPVNEYYCNAAHISKNAAVLQQAIALSINEMQVADRNLHPMHREKYGALIPSKSYIITPLLVYANALMFIAMTLAGVSFIHPTAKGLYQWGGNFRLAVTHGEWWRLGTYMFLHAGAMHLIMNAFALLYIGMFLEPLLGKLRFAAAYIFTGIFAGVMSITLHASSVGVGASGAIFGMYGVFLSLLTTKYIQKTLRKTMLRSIMFFVLLNLLYGLLETIMLNYVRKTISQRHFYSIFYIFIMFSFLNFRKKT